MNTNIEPNTLSHCNQCSRQCPVDDLHCGRGKRFFKNLQEEETSSILSSSQIESSPSLSEYEKDKCTHQHSHEEETCNHHGHKHSHEGKSCNHHGHNHSHEGGACNHHGHKHSHEDESCAHHRQNHACRGRKHHGHLGKKGCYDGGETMDELSILLGKCAHSLYQRPHSGRGQGRILKLLAQQDQLTQKELQEYLDIQSGSISEIISKLELKGMLTREKDESDRRKVILKITEEGREKVENCSKEEKRKDLYTALNEEEKNTLKELLKKLLDSWHEA